MKAVLSIETTSKFHHTTQYDIQEDKSINSSSWQNIVKIQQNYQTKNIVCPFLPLRHKTEFYSFAVCHCSVRTGRVLRGSWVISSLRAIISIILTIAFSYAAPSQQRIWIRSVDSNTVSSHLTSWIHSCIM